MTKSTGPTNVHHFRRVTCLVISAREDVFVHSEGWYADNDVDLRLGLSATAIDTDSHEVTLGQEERVRYDALLLATGAEPRRLDIPGADLSGVRYLRRHRRQ